MRRLRWFFLMLLAAVAGVGGSVAVSQGAAGQRQTGSGRSTVPHAVPSALAASPGERKVVGAFGESLAKDAEKARPERDRKRPDRSPATLAPSARAHRGRVTAATVRRNVRGSAPDLTLSHRLIPAQKDIREVLGDSAVRVPGPGGKGSQVMISSMPVASPVSTNSKSGEGVAYRIANLDWKAAGERFEMTRPVDEVSLPKLAGGVVRFEGGMNLRLAPAESTAEGEVSGESVTYPNIDTDTDMIVRSLPTGLGVGWSLRSPKAAHDLRVPLDLPSGQRIATGPTGDLSVVDDDDRPVAQVTPATAIDADGQGVPLETRVDGNVIVYSVDHSEGTVAYPVTVDPLFYQQYFSSGQQDYAGWIAQNTPNTPMPFSYVNPTQGQPGQLGIYAPPTTYMQGATAAWSKFAPGNPNYGDPQYGYGRRISVEHAHWTRFVAGNVIYAFVPTQYYHYYNYPIGQVGFGNQDGGTTGATTVPSGTNGGTFDLSSASNAPNDNSIGFGLTNPTNQYFFQYDHPAAAIGVGWYQAYAADPLPPKVTATPPTGWVDTVPPIPVSATDNGMGVQRLALQNAGGSEIVGRSFTCKVSGPEVCPFDTTAANGNSSVTFTLPALGEGSTTYYLVGTDGADLQNTGGLAPRLPVTVNVDRSAPKITAPNVGNVVRPDSTDASATKTIKVTTTDTYSGVKAVSAKVDGQSVSVTQPTCSNGSCPSSFDVQISATTLSNGIHTVAVSADDQLTGSNHHADGLFSFTVVHDPKNPPVDPGAGIDLGRKPVSGLGLQNWWSYDSTDTGAGSALRTNLSNGNAVWTVTPVQNPGIGLNSFLRLTYNSYEPSGLLPNLLGGGNTGLLGYGVAGRGFSVQMAGLTRLNEPLEIRGPGNLGLDPTADASLTQQIGLTDGTGTEHLFTKNASAPAGQLRFDAPKGVHLTLRRYDASTAAGNERFWAATRPDGTTFYFNRQGYATQIVDRHDNQIHFDYQASNNNPVCGFTIGCGTRVQYVTDSAGLNPAGLAIPSPGTAAADRRWELKYDDKDRLVDVLDRKRVAVGGSTAPRDTHLHYDTAGRLDHITEDSNGPATQQPDFALGYDGDSTYLTSVRDPNQNTTFVTYNTTNDPLGLGTLLSGLGINAQVKPVASVADRGSVANQSGPGRTRTTTYAFSTTPTGIGDTTITDARGIQDHVKTDARGRMTESDNATTVPGGIPNPSGMRKTLQGWTDDNTLQYSTIGAASSTTAVTTDYSWGALGELNSLTQHAGAEGSTSGLSRTQTWTYLKSGGTQKSAAAGDGDTMVYDLQKAVDYRGKATTYDYGTANPNRGDALKIHPDGAGVESFTYDPPRLGHQPRHRDLERPPRQARLALQRRRRHDDRVERHCWGQEVLQRRRNHLHRHQGRFLGLRRQRQPDEPRRRAKQAVDLGLRRRRQPRRVR
ncbi:hypothetical protein AB0L40_20745 [Patulibacter sp. NPDC049589]|uniref:hypothetical protein n=1 Tax=Patulibacter sp. NPDC049589 TaxID=3154731 RepID=UPI003421E6D7